MKEKRTMIPDRAGASAAITGPRMPPYPDQKKDVRKKGFF
jgi:hypothetical protein